MVKRFQSQVKFSFLLVDPDLGYWSIIWKVKTTNFIVILTLTFMFSFILNFKDFDAISRNLWWKHVELRQDDRTEITVGLNFQLVSACNYEVSFNHR